MSRNRRRWEEPSASHWEPGNRSYSDEYSGRRYGPPTELHPRRSFNYWRDSVVPPASHYSQHSHGRDNYNERWRDDSRRSWHAESSYSRRRHGFGPPRGRDDWDSRRDRDPPRPSPSRQRYPIDAPPYTSQPAIPATSPTESTPPFLKRVSPESPRNASPPPQPLGPCPRYLSISQEPSEILRDPTWSRKLLVLDLNGTLLIRSARSRASSGPQLRPVQPRPYMQSFRQYLFCSRTKAWLDTMVWSSAQPHSVDDMVEKVFGTAKGDLKAIWNRKSLGLSQADYHRKAVTTKDLTKPWDLFASALSPEQPKGNSAVSSPSKTVHSAFTTLLLDDSLHKAVLQPYNHVCIPEYDSKRRQHDLRSFLAAREPKQSKKARRKNHIETAAHSTDQIVPELFTGGALAESVEEEPYDVTLLAVTGILETLKLQSNVAGWIRQGGLWATQERGGESSALDVERHIIVKAGKMVSNADIQAENDTSGTSDTTATPEQRHLRTEMWFDNSSVVAFWAARGRSALMECGIQITHGVTG